MKVEFVLKLILKHGTVIREAFPLKRILEDDFMKNEPDNAKRERVKQIYITQWLILSRVYKNAIEQAEWYQALIKNGYEKITRKNSKNQIEKMSKEVNIANKLFGEEKLCEIEMLKRESELQERKRDRLNLKLVSLLEKIKDKGEGR